MLNEFVFNELKNTFEDVGNLMLNKYKISKEDLQFLDYKFNTIISLLIAYDNDADSFINAVTDDNVKRITKKKKKTTITKRKYTKKVNKTDEDNKDENIH